MSSGSSLSFLITIALNSVSEVDLPLFQLAFFLRLPPLLSFWDCFFVFPFFVRLSLLASAPGVHPPEVSGVGAPPGFQVWAPSLLIWVCATGLQVNAGAAYPEFTVQGLRGEGCQRQWLLQRVL